jgi:hypothetical protein
LREQLHLQFRRSTRLAQAMQSYKLLSPGGPKIANPRIDNRHAVTRHPFGAHSPRVSGIDRAPREHVIAMSAIVDKALRNIPDTTAEECSQRQYVIFLNNISLNGAKGIVE